MRWSGARCSAIRILLQTGIADQAEFYRPMDGSWTVGCGRQGFKIGDAVGLTFRDVTATVEEQRTLEARVAARTRELEQSQAARARTEAALAQAQRLETVGRLTGGVAHDFNNLLTVIIGGLDMILRAPDKTERVGRLAHNALEAARRGERLTRQLLAFSKHQELKLEVTEVGPVLAQIEPLDPARGGRGHHPDHRRRRQRRRGAAGHAPAGGGPAQSGGQRRPGHAPRRVHRRPRPPL